MKNTNPKVDKFLGKPGKWRKEMQMLRTIILSCGLTEELKWGKPCYTFDDNNVVILQGFKESCALMFFKGALLKDPRHVLQKPGANSRVARRVLFNSVAEITAMESVLKAYIREAVEAEKAGLKVTLPKKREPVPDELKIRFKEFPSLKTAFDTLTPGRQRAYILYFSAPRKSETRQSRIAKHETRILKGKGLNDR